jgi:hypothetical protein
MAPRIPIVPDWLIRKAASHRPVRKQNKPLGLLRHQRTKAHAKWKALDREISAIECRNNANARARAMTSAVAKSRIFRDGTPRDTPQHHEVARRYAWHAHNDIKMLPSRIEPHRTGSSPLMTRIRLRELERIFSSRYGKFLPRNAAGRDALVLAAHHIVRMGPNAEQHITDWARVWAPWMPAKHVADLATRVIANPVKFKADTVGQRLQLSREERDRLGITTIGADGQTVQERKILRQYRRRIAARLRRRRRGAKMRAEYEAGSLTRKKPWEALGMSRRTWYRRGRPGADSPL